MISTLAHPSKAGPEEEADAPLPSPHQVPRKLWREAGLTTCPGGVWSKFSKEQQTKTVDPASLVLFPGKN